MLETSQRSAGFTFDPPVREDIRLDALSDTKWRVIDKRLRKHDAPSVLGFIEEVDGVYETLVFGNGCARWSPRSLDEAVTLFFTPPSK